MQFLNKTKSCSDLLKVFRLITYRHSEFLSLFTPQNHNLQWTFYEQLRDRSVRGGRQAALRALQQTSRRRLVSDASLHSARRPHLTTPSRTSLIAAITVRRTNQPRPREHYQTSTHALRFTTLLSHFPVTSRLSNLDLSVSKRFRGKSKQS